MSYFSQIDGSGRREIEEMRARLAHFERENQDLRVKIARNEETIFELEATMTTFEVEAKTLADQTNKRLQSELSFSKQELSRLAQEHRGLRHELDAMRQKQASAAPTPNIASSKLGLHISGSSEKLPSTDASVSQPTNSSDICDGESAAKKRRSTDIEVHDCGSNGSLNKTISANSSLASEARSTSSFAHEAEYCRPNITLLGSESSYLKQVTLSKLQDKLQDLLVSIKAVDAGGFSLQSVYQRNIDSTDSYLTFELANWQTNELFYHYCKIRDSFEHYSKQHTIGGMLPVVDTLSKACLAVQFIISAPSLQNDEDSIHGKSVIQMLKAFRSFYIDSNSFSPFNVPIGSEASSSSTRIVKRHRFQPAMCIPFLIVLNMLAESIDFVPLADFQRYKAIKRIANLKSSRQSEPERKSLLRRFDETAMGDNSLPPEPKDTSPSRNQVRGKIASKSAKASNGKGISRMLSSSSSKKRMRSGSSDKEDSQEQRLEVHSTTVVQKESKSSPDKRSPANKLTPARLASSSNQSTINSISKSSVVTTDERSTIKSIVTAPSINPAAVVFKSERQNKLWKDRVANIDTQDLFGLANNYPYGNQFTPPSVFESDLDMKISPYSNIGSLLMHVIRSACMFVSHCKLLDADIQVGDHEGFSRSSRANQNEILNARSACSLILSKVGHLILSSQRKTCEAGFIDQPFMHSIISGELDDSTLSARNAGLDSPDDLGAYGTIISLLQPDLAKSSQVSQRAMPSEGIAAAKTDVREVFVQQSSPLSRPILGLILFSYPFSPTSRSQSIYSAIPTVSKMMKDTKSCQYELRKELLVFLKELLRDSRLFQLFRVENKMVTSTTEELGHLGSTAALSASTTVSSSSKSCLVPANEPNENIYPFCVRLGWELERLGPVLRNFAGDTDEKSTELQPFHYLDFAIEIVRFYNFLLKQHRYPGLQLLLATFDQNSSAEIDGVDPGLVNYLTTLWTKVVLLLDDFPFEGDAMSIRYHNDNRAQTMIVALAIELSHFVNNVVSIVGAQNWRAFTRDSIITENTVAFIWRFAAKNYHPSLTACLESCSYLDEIGFGDEEDEDAV